MDANCPNLKTRSSCIATKERKVFRRYESGQMRLTRKIRFFVQLSKYPYSNHP